MTELTKSEEERALKAHNEAFIVDSHCDTLLELTSIYYRKSQAGEIYRLLGHPRSLGERSNRGQIDLPRLIEGGVNCQTFAICTAVLENNFSALQNALQMVDVFNKECTSNEGIVKIHNYKDIIEANRLGSVAAILAMEGSEPLMGNLSVLRIFYELGVRMLSLTWNWRTPFADGLKLDRTKSRLTNLGVETIREMERLGMVFDVSHLNDSCFWDVMDVKKGPLIASHSMSRAINDHPKNLTDDMIIEMAEHNGVIGIEFVPEIIDKKKASIGRVVDHIDHIVDLVGVDYVGIGSDFDGMEPPFLKDLEDVSKLPNLTRELVRRNYSDNEIKKILGDNHLRVFKKVLK